VTGDVSKLTADELASWFGDSAVRVLAGCAPCQPFSSYSQRYETIGSERWGLLGHFARLATELRPEIVTMENVPTITKHAIFEDFLRALRRSGYRVWHEKVDAASLGLPQRRRRTVLLASLLGPISLLRSSQTQQRTVRDVLAALPPLRHGARSTSDPLHATSRLSPLNLKRIKASRPGGSWRDWPKHLVARCHRKTSGSSYPGVYGRMTWDAPAPTLTTQFYGFGSGRFGHPSQARALSLREGAILQGFPQGYCFVPEGGSVQFKVLGRLIGNAVPVDLGRAIGESIVEHVARHASRPLPPTNQRRTRQDREDSDSAANA
jgi:DNA (cytosine-5)-methyltransferase 1